MARRESKKSFFDQMDDENKEEYLTFKLDKLTKEHEELLEEHKRILKEVHELRGIIKKCKRKKNRLNLQRII